MSICDILHKKQFHNSAIIEIKFLLWMKVRVYSLLCMLCWCVTVAELQAYRELKRTISALKQKREEYRERCDALQGIDYSGIRVSGGLRKDKMVETAIAWADLDLLVKNKEVECERLLWDITAKLEQLQPNESKVLELYYIKGYNITKIEDIMYYSERMVRYIKTDALKHYAELQKYCL